MALSFLDPNTLARTYRDPVAWAILAVDLFPIVAVLIFGWGATPLVFLYWIENLIAGVVALARMTAASSRHGPIGLAGILFLGPFFTVHYGMFCFVHGIFVATFAQFSAGQEPGGPMFDLFGLIEMALSSGAYMPIFVWAIIVLQGFLFVRDYILRGEYKKADAGEEMAAPYARIFVLHIGIFAGAGAMAALGEPMIGILALILLRALWGVYLTVRRRSRIDAAPQLES